MRALAVDPTRTQTYIDLGRALAERGRYRQAGERFTEALTRGHDASEAHALLGLVSLASKADGAALQHYFVAAHGTEPLSPLTAGEKADLSEFAFLRQPDHSSVQRFAASALRGQSDAALRLTRLQQAIVNRHDEAADIAWAKVLQLLDKTDEAIAFVLDALKRDASARNVAAPLSAAAGTFGVAVRKTPALLKFADTDVFGTYGADRRCECLATLAHASVAPQVVLARIQKEISDTLDVRLAIGWCLAVADAGWTDDGVAALEQALAAHPNAVDVHRSIHAVVFHLSDDDRSAFATRYSATMVTDAASLALKGLVLAALERPDLAVPPLIDASAREPSNVLIRVRLAGVLLEAGQRQHALDAMVDALTTNGWSPDVIPFGWMVLRRALPDDEGARKACLTDVVTPKVENGQAGHRAELGLTLLANRGLFDRNALDAAVEMVTHAFAEDPSSEDFFTTLWYNRDVLPAVPELAQHLEAIASKTDNYGTHLRWGRVLSDLGRRKESAAWFERAGELDATGAEAFRSAGNALVELTVPGAPTTLAPPDLERALSNFAKAIDAEPDFEPGYDGWLKAFDQFSRADGVRTRLAESFGRGDATAVQVDWGAIRAAGARDRMLAVQLLSYIQENLDDGRGAICVKARKALHSCGQWDLADGAFQHGSEFGMEPDDRYSWAYALRQLGRYADAEQQYREYAKDRGDFNQLEGACARADLLCEQREFDRAATLYGEAFAKAPILDLDNKDQVQRRIGLLIDRMRALGASERYTEALALSDDILRIKGNHFWTHFRIGYTLSDMRRYDAAAEAYAASEQADRAHHYLAYPRHNVAELYETQGTYTRAREQWALTRTAFQQEVGSTIREGDAAFTLYYGRLLATVYGNTVAARQYYDAAQILAPTDPEIALERVKFYVGESKGSFRRQERITEAARTVRGAAERDAHWKATEAAAIAEELLAVRLKLNPRNVELLTMLGELHLVMQNNEGAIASLTQAVAINPKSGRINKALAEAQTRLGQYDSAIQYFRASLRSSPDDLSVKAALAQACLKNGLFDEAATTYLAILDVAPFHFDSLVGLGETYVERADKKGEGDAAQRELYLSAEQRLAEAIDLVGTDNEPSSHTRTLGSARYLRGYVRLKRALLAGEPFSRKHLLRNALEDFKKCPEDPNAARAISQIKEAKRDSRTFLERCAPAMVFVFSCFLFLGAQVGLFVGLPALTGRVTVNDQSIAAFTVAGVSTRGIDGLKTLVGTPFRSREDLLERTRTLVPAADLAHVRSAIVEGTVVLHYGWDFVPLGAAMYTSLTFGALILMIACAYLPQLTSLKLPGVQLDKSADPIGTVRSIGVTWDLSSFSLPTPK